MKKQFKQLAMAIIVVGALFIGSGCISSLVIVRKCISSNAKPVVLNKVHAEKISKVSNSNLIVKIGMPKDNRGEKPNFFGYVRNVFFIHTADVCNDKPVSLWVQEVIISNLEKAGIKAQAFKENSGENNGIFVETEIAKLSCDIGTQYKADINLLIKLKNRGSVVLNEVYCGQATKVNWWGGASGYSEMTKKAMKLCINKLMPELIKTIKEIEKTMPKSNKKISFSKIKNELPAFLK